MAFEDKTITCVECSTAFAFTAREQEFYESKGFTNEPRRCPTCRRARKVQRGDAPQRVEAPPQAVGARPRSAAGREPREVREPVVRTTQANNENSPQNYTTTCNACGGEAVLSFEPTGNRAVLCKACYEKIGAFA